MYVLNTIFFFFFLYIGLQASCIKCCLYTTEEMNERQNTVLLTYINTYECTFCVLWCSACWWRFNEDWGIIHFIFRYREKSNSSFLLLLFLDVSCGGFYFDYYLMKVSFPQILMNIIFSIFVYSFILIRSLCADVVSQQLFFLQLNTNCYK